MTRHGHLQGHSPGGKQGREHGQGEDGGPAALLDLDAEVLDAYLSRVTAWVGELAPSHVSSVLDLGAGTGTGSIALAGRFPGAQVTAIDNSAEMLGRVRGAAGRRGLTGRIETVQSDLDAGWPELRPMDVAWAASSMHHFADPDRVLRGVFGALRPGGLFVVIEMDDLPRFLPRDIGFGRPGFETRVHEAMTRAGANPHPNWQPFLARAGFDPIEVGRFSIDTDPAPPRTSEYAEMLMRRCREGVGDQLDTEDSATLDRLLDGDDPAGLAQRTDLTISGSRTAWAARRGWVARRG